MKKKDTKKEGQKILANHYPSNKSEQVGKKMPKKDEKKPMKKGKC